MGADRIANFDIPIAKSHRPEKTKGQKTRPCRPIIDIICYEFYAVRSELTLHREKWWYRSNCCECEQVCNDRTFCDRHKDHRSHFLSSRSHCDRAIVKVRALVWGVQIGCVRINFRALDCLVTELEILNFPMKVRTSTSVEIIQFQTDITMLESACVTEIDKPFPVMIVYILFWCSL